MENEVKNHCCSEKNKEIYVCCENKNHESCNCSKEKKQKKNAKICCYEHNQLCCHEECHHSHNEHFCEKCGSFKNSSCGCGGKHIGGKKETVKQIVILAVSLVFLVIGYFDWKHISNGTFTAFYYVNPAYVTLLLCGIPIFISAIKTLRQKKIKASVLISIAMLSCIALEIVGFFVKIESIGGHEHSYIFAAGEIAFLMSLGDLIEGFTIKKCRSGIERLISLIPKEANVLKNGEIVKTKLSDVAVGDLVLVKSGEMVAVDGVIISGSASIDQSSVTGEYVPVDLTSGNNVYGGTMNLSGTIEVKTTKLEKDMTIARLAELTIEAEGKKAPVSRLADKWVAIIVPAVLLASLIVGIIAGFGFRVGVINAIIRSITILVVFCPCALALATPTAIAAGLGRSAANGVLIKSGESLEQLSRVKIVCFDKTGTLTSGQIKLDEIKGDKTTLYYAASLEKYSEHPLSKAVVEKAKDLKLGNASNIKTLAGEGISGIVDGKMVEIISYFAAIKRRINLEEYDIDTYLGKGNTVSLVLLDGKILGLLTFSDTLREDAAKSIFELKQWSIQPYMLTGDNLHSAKNIASACGIENVKAQLLPEQKLMAIEDLKKNGKVCMLGDGINDAPSLAAADVSVAMGALKSDIAIDSADMAILDSDVSKFNETLKLSKKVMNAIRRNIIIAMGINLVSVILSLFGLLTPVTGALVHNCTSLFVVASSALILYKRKRRTAK